MADTSFADNRGIFVCHHGVDFVAYSSCGICLIAHVGGVDLIRIYECLCDRTRLRILALLGGGPLCVCHLQEILGEPQVKISKHLGYLKERGLVEGQREGNWMIYRLATKPSHELQANLACLQDCAADEPVFRRDATKLAKVRAKLARADCPCAVRNG